MSFPDLPGYIHFPLWDRSHLSPADCDELEQCGGLVIPPAGLRDHSIRGFAEFVYPQMPIVNVQGIVAAVDGAGGEPISLLLFQAIMFAGVSYVPLETLQEYGYSSHTVARRDLYRRVEACFNATAHARLADPVVLIQSALLLTLWYDPLDTSKDGHYWMRAVIALSADMGMHHSPPRAKPPRDPATLRLWRRIAWVTYARDRIILLGARLPALIRAADLTLTPLTINDFELEPIQSHGTSCLPLDCTLFRDRLQIRTMAALCVEQVLLAQCIDAVFTPQVDTMPTSTSFAPSLATSDANLKTWWSRCVLQDKYIEDYSPSLLDHQHRGIIIQRIILRLTYCTIISALYRPLVLRGAIQVNPALGVSLLDICKESLDHATENITKLAEYLNIHRLSLYLPASVVTSLLSALIVHMSASGAVDVDVKSAGLLGFRTCLLLLDRLRQRHGNAEDVFCFLERTVVNASEDASCDASHMSELFRIFEEVKHEALFMDERNPGPSQINMEQHYNHSYDSNAFKWPVDTANMSDEFPFLEETQLDFSPDANFDLSSTLADLDAIFADVGQGT